MRFREAQLCWVDPGRTRVSNKCTHVPCTSRHLIVGQSQAVGGYAPPHATRGVAVRKLSNGTTPRARRVNGMGADVTRAAPAHSSLFQIDPHDPVPTYIQLERRIRVAVADGVLQPGAALPSIRDVAHRLGISPNTVGRAYADLAREGVILARAGGGSAVAPRERLDQPWTPAHASGASAHTLPPGGRARAGPRLRLAGDRRRTPPRAGASR